MAERSWWGWGTVDRMLDDDHCRSYAQLIEGLPPDPLPVPAVDELELAPSRIASLPGVLEDLFSAVARDRVSHAYGKSYRDVVRALRGDVSHAPDLVASPRNESDVSAILDWATARRVVVVPYGGGSSVVGGVEYRGEEPWVSLDLSNLDRVLEMDETSHAARIQAGVLGPALEGQLRSGGWTMRFFPQSFEFSSLGGWIATRAGGHFATLHTHIDDLVESIRAVTPSGIYESLRVPASGAGPSPDRLLLGSEGTLGVLTEAWMRIRRRPRYKLSASLGFGAMSDAMAAVRAISQSGLWPSNCRLLDPGEAAFSGTSRDGRAVLILGVESPDQPLSRELEQLVGIAKDHGGRAAAAEPSSGGRPGSGAGRSGPGGGGAVVRRGSGGRSSTGDSAADTWRESFMNAPYARDAMARMSGIVETFESACTWDRAEHFCEIVRERVGEAVKELTGRPGMVNCRFTHVYPDGPAPYFTVIGVGRRGSELEMWNEIKAVAMDVVASEGGTVTHHHAVGRDHRPGYDRQRPEPFAAVLRAAKQTLDPAGVLNPGVLID